MMMMVELTLERKRNRYDDEAVVRVLLLAFTRFFLFFFYCVLLFPCWRATKVSEEREKIILFQLTRVASFFPLFTSATPQTAKNHCRNQNPPDKTTPCTLLLPTTRFRRLRDAAEDRPSTATAR